MWAAESSFDQITTSFFLITNLGGMKHLSSSSQPGTEEPLGIEIECPIGGIIFERSFVKFSITGIFVSISLLEIFFDP